VEVVASLSQGPTAAAQCGLFTYKSVPVIFEPPCTFQQLLSYGKSSTNYFRHLLLLYNIFCINLLTFNKYRSVFVGLSLLTRHFIFCCYSRSLFFVLSIFVHFSCMYSLLYYLCWSVVLFLL